MAKAEKGNVEDEIDALFRLPLAEFTSARNTLAASLKQSGHRDAADRVKLLAKPSISSWAVNQLYWLHREEFDQLIATSKRFHQKQTNLADRRDSLDARRESVANLSDLAAALLRDAGHSPTLDTMRRITTTLEAISTYALLPDGPTPGRLNHDVDPPSFEALASLMSGARSTKPSDEPARITPSRKASATTDVRRVEEARQAKIAAAKVSLQDAKRSLSDARARAQSLEAAQKKANAEVKEAEKYRRAAEERLEEATAVAEDAARRAQSVAAEVKEVAKELEDAKRMVESETKQLELLFKESPR